MASDCIVAFRLAVFCLLAWQPSGAWSTQIRNRQASAQALPGDYLGGPSVALSLDERLQLTLVTPAAVRQNLEAGRVPASGRQNRIESLFRQAGCEVRLQPMGRHSSNVICSLPGETNATVVVGAHYDFVDRGQGIVDDWSGVSLLVSLYQTLKTTSPKHAYQFIAFAGEERGLLGSSFYVNHLNNDQKAQDLAFVNLECLGLTAPKVWIHRSTPALVYYLTVVAKASQIPLEGREIDKVGDDDTHPFLAKKIPVITIHSLTQETLPILHSSRDTIDAINAGCYYDAYRLAAFYLKYLDAKLPSPAR